MSEPAQDAPMTLEEQLMLTEAGISLGLHDALSLLRRINPDLTTQVAACQIFGWVAKALGEHMPMEAIRSGLLYAFEETHPQPMNFIQIAKAKDAIQSIANGRSTVLRQRRSKEH